MKTTLTLRDLGYAADLLSATADESRRRQTVYRPTSQMWAAYARDALAYDGIAKRLRDVCADARANDLDINSPIKITVITPN